MCEHMHNDVHAIRMYKGERVGPYLSQYFFCNGLFVTVTILTVTLCTIKIPYGAHNGYTFFPSNLVSFHLAFLSSALTIVNPVGRGVKSF